jgi:hypothetical protein
VQADSVFNAKDSDGAVTEADIDAILAIGEAKTKDLADAVAKKVR